MRIKLWREHGATNAGPVFDAFEHSCNNHGLIVTDSNNHGDADCDVIWSVLFHGRMANNKSIWTNNRKHSRPTIVLEVGGISRGSTWKVGLNGINRDGCLGPNNTDNNRARDLGLELLPWRTDGDCILICGQHDKSLQWANMPSMTEWVCDTVEQVRAFSDRPILIRPHPRCRIKTIEQRYSNVYRQEPRQLKGTYDDFDMGFKDVWATINFSSNPGIHSILHGIPAFVGTSSLAYPVANDIDFMHDIENPMMPDRQQWINDYAWTEYTIDEIAAGIPLNYLTSLL